MAERPEDLNLPTSVVSRIIKEALPEGVNVSKEAKAAISKAASVFVLYATSCANNFAMKSKRKTLTGQDVLSAMEDMEFGKFVDPLREKLEAFRTEQRGKKEASDKRKKSKVSSSSSSSQPTTPTSTPTTTQAPPPSSNPPMKGEEEAAEDDEDMEEEEGDDAEENEEEAEDDEEENRRAQTIEET